MVEIIKLEGEKQVSTVMRYYGENMFRIDKKMLDDLAGYLRRGDQMLITITGFNKINNNNGEDNNGK